MEDFFTEKLLPEMWENPTLSRYPKIYDLADYITEQWIDNSYIPQKYWNINGHGVDDRTNNFTETWHSKWNGRINANHQHVWKLTCQLLDYHEFQ